MKVVLWLSLFYIGYGIAGLLGFQVIPDRCKGKEWTKHYVRCRGISWLLIGIPWLILYWVDMGQMWPFQIRAVLIVLCAVPSIIYSVMIEKR